MREALYARIPARKWRIPNFLWHQQRSDLIIIESIDKGKTMALLVIMDLDNSISPRSMTNAVV